MPNQEYQRIDAVHVRPECLILVLIAIVNIISFGGFAIYWITLKFGYQVGLKSLQDLSKTIEGPMSHKCIIDKNYLIPNLHNKELINYKHRKLIPVILLLESYYRKQGIDLGYLANDQMLLLSFDKMKQLIDNFCTNDSCYDLDTIYFKKSINSSFLTFPFKDNHVNVNYVKDNPLRFNLISFQTFNGIDNLKRKILNSKRPYYVSLPILKSRQWLNCNNFISNDICKLKLFEGKDKNYVFPFDIQIDNQLIYDTFFTNTEAEYTSLLLVGYNDDFIFEPNSYNSLKRGGFIFYNNFGGIGHSLKYLLGMISKFEERKYCPNPNDVYTWIPSNFECIKQNSINNCSKEIILNIGNETLKGATQLKCINSNYCDPRKKYVLLRDNIYLYSLKTINNIKYANIINIDDERIELINTLPFELLYNAFTPEYYPKPTEKCDFIILSHKTMEWISKNSNWNVYDFQVNWLEMSYPNKNHNFNYGFLNQSIIKFNYTFDFIDENLN